MHMSRMITAGLLGVGSWLAVPVASAATPNPIPQPLARLVGAGLVVETTAPATGRGRPRLRYGVAPAVDSRA